MKVYLSLGSCKEIFNVMTQVTKNKDEGRLKMKPHCPIVTDVGVYAYDKLVEGLYRPGYFEALGDVILKRFLLLVLVLDRAKSQSCLPIKYGIDGLDGGSPLLFTLQPNIKSSCHVIHDFLSSDVMHGEGNVLAHLVIVGYKVSYLQSPFNEYDFRVKELFEDLQDGVRLCRAIQHLQHDASILMKMLVPLDTRKKNVVNCGIALQHLKQAGVPLFDEDGSMIVAEDIVSGDKELTLLLLWIIFVHLLLPLLINKTLILEEISRIQGVNARTLEQFPSFGHASELDLEAICKSYDFKVDNFASLVDGKAMWCLLDYYFWKELNCSYSLKDIRETSGETSIMSVSDYTDVVHNFILSQKFTTLLGNFPVVLQVSDILEHNGPCNSQSVIILLVFLSFQLLVRKNTCQKLFDCYRHAATEIQQFVRGQIARRRLLGASFLPKIDPTGCIVTSTDCFQNLELATRSYWKGYLAWKASRGQLLDLCLRLQKSAANVDDSMRIINRLLVALSDLLSIKSVSGILHTCATLDMATKHSKKCYEKLVEAEAVDMLLKLIRSVNRSIPDQEVPKHALSTLRNLARYSHLTEVLIRSRGSIEMILWKLLRNKEEGYFIAFELLRKICLNTKGVEATRNSPALLKRLHNLLEDLTREIGNEKSGLACKRAVGEKIKAPFVLGYREGIGIHSKIELTNIMFVLRDGEGIRNPLRTTNPLGEGIRIDL
ncbi:unnamed protein product [Camellia sinensis]